MRRRREDDPDAESVELAALADGSLAPERRAALEARVATSSDLAERLREQQHALALARSARDRVEAPAALRARIEAQRHVRPARLPRRPVLVAAAASAAVAVTVGVIVVSTRTSGERFHATLAATGLLPGASGDATLVKTSSGWRIELNATGLPHIAGGCFYEAWLRNTAGVLVPVGTFNEGRRVTLWAGVSPTRFTTLTVTRERADGDQASSGEKVLTGRVDVGG
jgi:hypothetical protein